MFVEVLTLAIFIGAHKSIMGFIVSAHPHPTSYPPTPPPWGLNLMGLNLMGGVNLKTC